MSTPYSEWLGIEVEQAEDGTREAVLAVGAHHTNKRGVVHGGMVSTLLDMGLGAAVIGAMTPEEWCGTVSLDIQFVRPTRGAVVRARGRLINRGKRIAFAEGELVDDRGRICARAQGVWHIWPSHPDR